MFQSSNTWHSFNMDMLSVSQTVTSLGLAIFASQDHECGMVYHTSYDSVTFFLVFNLISSLVTSAIIWTSSTLPSSCASDCILMIKFCARYLSVLTDNWYSSVITNMGFQRPNNIALMLYISPPDGSSQMRCLLFCKLNWSMHHVVSMPQLNYLFISGICYISDDWNY